MCFFCVFFTDCTHGIHHHQINHHFGRLFLEHVPGIVAMQIQENNVFSCLEYLQHGVMKFPKSIFYAARKSHPACTYCDSTAKKQSEVLICRKCALVMENWMTDCNPIPSMYSILIYTYIWLIFMVNISYMDGVGVRTVFLEPWTFQCHESPILVRETWFTSLKISKTWMVNHSDLTWFHDLIRFLFFYSIYLAKVKNNPTIFCHHSKGGRIDFLLVESYQPATTLGGKIGSDQQVLGG